LGWVELGWGLGSWVRMGCVPFLLCFLFVSGDWKIEYSILSLNGSEFSIEIADNTDFGYCVSKYLSVIENILSLKTLQERFA
jgi:hypothetical protein